MSLLIIVAVFNVKTKFKTLLWIMICNNKLHLSTDLSPAT